MARRARRAWVGTRLAGRRRTLCGRDLAVPLRALLDERQQPEPADRLLVRSGTKLVVVQTAPVDWAEAAGDYVALHVGPQTHLLRETLTGLEERLGGRRFVRIHRSAIVQVHRVRDVKLTAADDVTVRLRDGTEVRASRRYWTALAPRLGGAA
jgi:two-component system LytT family response regulator